MAMSLQGRDEAGQDCLEALAADPVRRLPEDDKGFAHCLIVGPSINGRGFGLGGADGGE